VRKTLRLKANKGMELTGMDIGIATEGTFGPDPVAPHICAHTETMIVIDRGNDLEITEQLVSHETNYEQLLYKPGGDLESFLERIGFPEHAVIVQPEEPKLFNRLFKEPGTVKGVRDYDLLLTTLEQICRASRTGRAVIETDMRAGMNPTRMKVIRKLGKVMTDRLQRHCPACEVPGWGITFRKQGLPCSGCGMPTQFTLNEIWSCSACGFSDEQPRSDGKQKADPGYCHFCNP
ncbi:MAG: DUF6671 family protein, partial [Balneolaceae bacterium]|nr:DUF6671 family protein [Balneolaceae bacterium]